MKIPKVEISVLIAFQLSSTLICPAAARWAERSPESYFSSSAGIWSRGGRRWAPRSDSSP